MTVDPVALQYLQQQLDRQTSNAFYFLRGRDELATTLRNILRADSIDRRMGYPLNGTSALHAALVEAEEILARVSPHLPPEQEQG